MAHDVFISYSSHDKKVADAACARLEQRGRRCWIAPRDVGGGEWGKAIVDGIREARIFVLIFSGHANRSPQVNREVERAVSKGIPIIPLRIEDVVPSDSLEYFISNQHWLDALTPPLNRHLGQLADVVERLLGDKIRANPAESSEAMSPHRRKRALGWWAGLGATVAAIAALLLLPRLAAVEEAPIKKDAAAPVAPASAVAPPARDWLYGRWCVDGDREAVQTISGDGERIVISFNGQRQEETVQESNAVTLASDIARYRRDGDAVIVSEPAYTFRLERCE